VKQQSLAHLAGIAVLFAVLSASCSRQTYPLGHTVRSAYKSRLRSMRLPYRRFTPVAFPADSLAAAQWTAPSPNFDVRTPVLVIIHQTEENSCAQSLHTLTNPNTSRKVSANYLVCRDGSVYKLVDEHYRAWQAGVSRWGSFHNINSISLGIELDNTGAEPFTGKQISSLLVILRSIKNRYHIPRGNFIAHADVAPTRRQDPSVYFPWKALAARGFGYWRDSVLPSVPCAFDYKTGLRLIGYDIRDTTAALVAFKRHFIQTDVSPELTAYDRSVLYDIFLKYDR
jgi:N-acetylmuramoyl-L-alanine amidase